MKKYYLAPITEEMEKEATEQCNEDHCCDDCTCFEEDGCKYWGQTLVRVDNDDKTTAMALLEQLNNITLDYEARELSETDWEDLNHEQLVCLSTALMKFLEV